MIEIGPEAQTAIDEIAAWLFDHASADVARRFVKQLEATFIFLERHRGAGSVFLADDPRLYEIRVWPTKGFPNHLIYYRALTRGIEVVDVIHAARDYPRFFGET